MKLAQKSVVHFFLRYFEMCAMVVNGGGVVCVCVCETNQCVFATFTDVWSAPDLLCVIYEKLFEPWTNYSGNQRIRNV